jgi:uncharacterized protein (TIGR02996 family)
MPPTNSESPHPQGVNRRSFLVTLFGGVVGSYFLPSLELEPLGAPEALTVATRLLISKPSIKKVGSGLLLVWMEQSPTGQPAVMVWNPQTPTECEEAQRFYDDCVRLTPAKGDTEWKPSTKRDPLEQKLITAILDDLDNNEPRLAYADWLTDQGSSRGEFIRIYIISGQMSKEDPRYQPMQDRFGQLVLQDAKKWFAPLFEMGLSTDFAGIFDPSPWLVPKGLTEEMYIESPGILPEQATRLFAAAPFIHSLTFNCHGVDIPGIAALPQLAQVTSLAFAAIDLDCEAVGGLLSSPYLGRLRALDFFLNKIGETGAQFLAASPLSSQLETLKLHWCGLGDRGVQTLLRTRRFSQLKTLELGHNDLHETGIRYLAAASELSQLRELGLSANPLGASGILALRTAPFLSSLTSLDLSNCELVGTTAGTHLAAVPFGDLQSLMLDNNPLGTPGAQALARTTSPYLGRLRKLNLRWCELGDSGLQVIASAKSLTGLTALDLWHNEIGDEGISAFATEAKFTELTDLDLTGNKCGAAGAKALAMSPCLRNLTYLDLTENPIQPAGAMALAASPYFKNLQRLTVTESCIGTDGKQALLKTFGEDVMLILS